MLLGANTLKSSPSHKYTEFLWLCCQEPLLCILKLQGHSAVMGNCWFERSQISDLPPFFSWRIIKGFPHHTSSQNDLSLMGSPWKMCLSSSSSVGSPCLVLSLQTAHVSGRCSTQHSPVILESTSGLPPDSPERFPLHKP